MCDDALVNGEKGFEVLRLSGVENSLMLRSYDIQDAKGMREVCSFLYELSTPTKVYSIRVRPFQGQCNDEPHHPQLV